MPFDDERGIFSTLYYCPDLKELWIRNPEYDKNNSEDDVMPYPKKKDPYEVDHIDYGVKATVVHWADGTRTVVKCAKGTPWNMYNAFCAALAKKVYGNNTKVREIVEKKNANYIFAQEEEEKKKRIEEHKAEEARLHAKRIKKLAKKMRDNEEAADLAFGRIENL